MYKYQRGESGLEKSSKRALRLYELAAAQGHAEAQCALAILHHTGDGVKINCKTALQWYRRAAEQGYPLAQNNLGMAFANGHQVPQSIDEALNFKLKWFRLVAAQGYPVALFNLGDCHANGHGCAAGLRRGAALLSSPSRRARATLLA
jgi:hypothetical protein